MPSEPNKNQTTTICLTVEADRIPVFLPLLAQGFTLETQIGCSVKDLLCSQIGLSADYVERRLQTIFLDGKAVDDIETAVVHPNATLALSAAMPGLVGATLRRGGAYAAMRRQVTHNKKAPDDTVENGTVVLKLFNLVAEEIGPMFLGRGIWINGENLQNFLQKLPDHFWIGIRSVEIDGNTVPAKKLVYIIWKQQVFLKVKASIKK